MSALIRSLQAFCYRVPLAVPVVTSFGQMRDRPAVFIRMEDEGGIVGWGEAWCNFPSVGAEHRARLVNDVLAPRVVGQDSGPPGALHERLVAETAVLAVQAGEPGPLAQAIAGIDTAHADLCARRQGIPLYRMLGGSDPDVAVYASGINPTGAPETALRALARGHRAFKLKIGFDAAADDANLAAIRREVGDLFLAADANQAWTPAEAAARLPALRDVGLGWLEEPIRADLPWEAWARLAGADGPPLAGGENIAGEEAFAEAFRAGILTVIQPDLAKWGGLSLCSRVGRAALAAGRRFCPHYLGGGIGLLASAHLLAAVGGDGMLEIDINDNPLRDLLCGPVGQVRDGRVRLGERPGLGVEPDLDALAQWRTL